MSSPPYLDVPMIYVGIRTLPAFQVAQTFEWVVYTHTIPIGQQEKNTHFLAILPLFTCTFRDDFKT